jgi:hypothetical protein
MTTSDEHENYKEVALERFHDAVVLYRAGRYSASLYMSGFVIEIGLKHKLFQLKNLSISQTAPQSILYLFMPQLPKPLPVRFRDVIELIISIQESKKESSKMIKNEPHVKTLRESRYYTPPIEKKVDGEKVSLHNNRNFFKQLLEWYEVSKPEHHETKQLKKFYECREFSELYPDELNIKVKSVWSTSIRYNISQQEHSKEDVLKHLNLCVTFLQDVLEYGRNEIGEDFLAELADQQNKELY